ncbi:MAG: chemotaxis protein CheW [Steroidobacteraceae bacterium]
MRSGRIEKRKQRKRHSEAVILFTVAEHAFAISAQSVEEIRNLDGLLILPHGIAKGSISKVQQALERETKTYFVVEGNLHFHLKGSHANRLLLLRDAPVALSVDAVNRMAEIVQLHPLPRAFQGEERAWYRGLALLGDEVVPLLNPAALLDARAIESLQAAYIAAEEAAKPGPRTAASA